MISGAMIVMTILGCDDAVTSCHYVETVKGSWASISACDSHSQAVLPRFTKVKYPVIVAMCEKQGEGVAATLPGALPQPAEKGAQVEFPVPDAAKPLARAEAPMTGQPKAPAQTDARTTLDQIEPAPAPPEGSGLMAIPTRAYDFIRNRLPGREQVRDVLTAPVHYVSDSYSWVARRIVP
ncbi:hypothetical protein BJF93_10970 [Xaviernesmea oryzae]|uniref:Uncharacterized protein n=1 Tax=Xaviernesmea oryzae TaxID=464029 RepID=A0A1Q9AXC9_9HYPH|nr:hypothetical protein [Xaviernesmea oryzae]OLP60086.1 hypothetical protein BJF93_10970 [Xaviernesmea oryzae]SEK37142.1 hypothetical protein SAMN04487976_10217 [Xaviernesmea oryzae]